MKRIQKFLSALVLTVLALSAWADAPGKNGAPTIAAANSVINQYDVLALAAAAGGTAITVNNIANLAPTGDHWRALGQRSAGHRRRGAAVAGARRNHRHHQHPDLRRHQQHR